MNELQLKVALNAIPQIGPLLIRRLVAYAGGVEAVFSEKKRSLEKIPGIGTIKAAGFNRDQALREAETELEYLLKNGITPLFYLDREYPERLRECEDGPIILYVKGEVDFNADKILSIVGTRNATLMGKDITNEVVSHLADHFPEIIIVSGLAHGIDIAAHKMALEKNVRTIAALGHGFEYLYPAAHRPWARKITRQGALVTEFQSHRKPDPGNFVSRNRIIAGLADASLIVESAQKGGALITADLANSYNREVFAIPGRNTDPYSRGCNQLIKQNKAALVENGADIASAMGWMSTLVPKIPVQKSLFYDLNPEEKSILSCLDEKGDSALDSLSLETGIPVARLSAILLSLEFKGFVKPLPGKYYRRN